MSVTCITTKDLKELINNLSHSAVERWLIRKDIVLRTNDQSDLAMRQELFKSLRVPSGPGTGNLAEHSTDGPSGR